MKLDNKYGIDMKLKFCKDKYCKDYMPDSLIVDIRDSVYLEHAINNTYYYNQQMEPL